MGERLMENVRAECEGEKELYTCFWGGRWVNCDKLMCREEIYMP